MRFSHLFIYTRIHNKRLSIGKGTIQTAKLTKIIEFVKHLILFVDIKKKNDNSLKRNCHSL